MLLTIIVQKFWMPLDTKQSLVPPTFISFYRTIPRIQTCHHQSWSQFFDSLLMEGINRAPLGKQLTDSAFRFHL